MNQWNVVCCSTQTASCVGEYEGRDGIGEEIVDRVID